MLPFPEGRGLRETIGRPALFTRHSGTDAQKINFIKHLKSHVLSQVPGLPPAPVNALLLAIS